MESNTSPNSAQQLLFSQNYDLHGRSNIFNVVYDLFKPRPHFVIRVKGGQSWCAFDVKHPQFMEELIDVAFDFGGQFTNPVLSIHRGSCIEGEVSFSARVCVGKEEFIQHYDSYKNKIPNWPVDHRPPSEHWVASHIPSNYTLNVLGYPYNNQRLADIKEIAQCNWCFELINTCRNRNNWQLIFHPSDARIGFTRIGPAKPEWKQEMVEMISTMDELAEGNFEGCHLCLSLANKDIGGFEGNVRAYLQISALEFYQCCPDSWQWFESYLKNPQPVMT